MGFHRPEIFRSKEKARRTFSLALSKIKDVASPHHGAVYALDIDPSESRYLLSGGSDTIIAVYDLETISFATKKANPDTTNNSSSSPVKAIKSKSTIPTLFTIERGEGHAYGVSSVQWYGHDNGMFFSGSFDHTIKVWDTNEAKAVRTFTMEGKVYSISYSKRGVSHSLIAAGTEEHRGRLCDIRTGNATHVLTGHREAIRAVKWSPINEFLLVTGSEDKTIRFWDIRKAGCLMSLDQQGKPETAFVNKKFKLTTNTQLAKSTVATAHDGAINGLTFTPNGHFLLSTGTDSRMRCWNATTGINTFVNFPRTFNTLKNSIQLSVSANGMIVYHPTGNNINAYSVHSGDLYASLQGHFEKVNCCIFHPTEEELYSGSNDHQILAWTPHIEEREDEEAQEEDEEEDNWSDDD